MAVDESIGIGLIMSVAFWAAALGGISALGVWALIMFLAKSRKYGIVGEKAMERTQGAGTTVTEPAEEGGQLDEWDADRLDRAA